jgi:coenzyme PQQ precursor peptide PqqA
MIEPVLGFDYPPHARDVLSQSLYRNLPDRVGPIVAARDRQKNPLIRHCFDGARHRWVNYCASHHRRPGFSNQKDFAGEVLVPHYVRARARSVRFDLRRAKMAWKAPKIVEVPVGMEINMYACAARK